MQRQARFKLIYERHAPAVKAYIVRRGCASVVDDLAAEVFIVAWRRFEEIPPEPLPWLLGVARRVLSTDRRGERRRRALRDRLSDGIVSSPQFLEAPSHEHAVLAALACLSDADQELLLLVAWDELSPTQAGAVLGLKPGAARVRLHRARRRLERAIQSQNDERASPQPLAKEASA